ncbi:hypothetical protein Tco_0005781 [Tanacetum coccineum]
MSAADPEAPSQDVATPSHLRKRVRKEKQCSKGWKKVYFTGSETKRRVCLYTQATQGVGRTTGTQKAATKVPDQEQRSPPLRDVITKGHPREERRSCQKAKDSILWNNTSSRKKCIKDRSKSITSGRETGSLWEVFVGVWAYSDECMHLRKQIKEMLKEGKLSHLVKEIKQNNGKEQPGING